MQTQLAAVFQVWPINTMPTFRPRRSLLTMPAREPGALLFDQALELALSQVAPGAINDIEAVDSTQTKELAPLPAGLSYRATWQSQHKPGRQ